MISNLVNIESFEVGEETVKPQAAATTVVGESEVYLEGLLDPEKEREKLGKQRQKLEGGISGIEKKLANPGFAEKAPAAVVESERARLQQLRQELEIIDRSLEELEG